MVGFVFKFDDAMILTMICKTSATDAFTSCGGDFGFDNDGMIMMIRQNEQ